MSADLNLPPGFRFHPTDEELVTHYLCRKCASQHISVPIVAELDLYRYDPWELPSMALYGEKDWFFFSPRDRKYPNGSRPNRAAGSGYWKATGADKPVCGTPGKPIAIKKALVFYAGKAPKGEKSNWIMHEYRLADVDRSARKKNCLRLDDWVLCRIYNKKGGADKQQLTSSERNWQILKSPEIVERKPEMITHSATNFPATTTTTDVQFGSSDSVPRMHTDSSCSEHVLSPEFTCEREVQSEPKWKDWARALDSSLMVDPMIGVSNPSSQFDGFPFQDMFSYLHKPF